MNRRGFLAGLAAVVGVGATQLVAAPPMMADRGAYRGWDVRWSGWLKPLNQLVQLGYWSAHKGDRILVSATTGTREELKVHASCFDTSRHRDWPWIDAVTNDSERETVKQRAWQQLRDLIDEDRN